MIRHWSTPEGQADRESIRNDMRILEELAERTYQEEERQRMTNKQTVCNNCNCASWAPMSATCIQCGKPKDGSAR